MCSQLSVDLNCRGGLPLVSPHRHQIIESIAAAHFEGDACDGANMRTDGVIEMVKLEISAS